MKQATVVQVEKNLALEQRGASVPRRGHGLSQKPPFKRTYLVLQARYNGVLPQARHRQAYREKQSMLELIVHS